MKRARGSLLLVIGVVVAVSNACTDVDPAGPVQGTFPNRSYRPEAYAAVSAFQHDLALALGDVAVRRAIHRALQASPLYEHKVIVDEFLRTEEGAVLLTGIAGATGRPEAEVRRLAASLPRLHLYVPMVSDRRSWRFEEPIAVVAWLDDQGGQFALTASGDSLAVDRRAPRPELPMALLLLGPDEPTGIRRMVFSRIGELPGDRPFIESAGEGTVNQECWEECGGGGGGGGGGPPPSDSLWVDSIQTFAFCDNDNCYEGNEFQFWAGTTGGAPGVNIFCYGVWSQSAPYFRAAFDHCGTQRKLHDIAPSEWSAGIEIDGKELDGFPNADDTLEEWITNRPAINVPSGPHPSQWIAWFGDSDECPGTCPWVKLLVRW